MKNKKIFNYLMVAATVGILFSSCKKKQDDVTDTDTNAAGDHALAEGTYNDVQNIADEAASGSVTSYMGSYNSNEKGMLSTCAVVNNDTTVNPHLLTINFGATNCLCVDGRYRRGQINVSYVGHYRDSASTHTITFTNYFVNDNEVQGSKTVVNNGHNSAWHLTFSITVNGTIIKANNGGTVTWTSSRTREWIQGESTPTLNDDVYLVTGSASGTNAHGNAFTASITSALRRELSCHQFVSGIVELTPSGKPTRTIDFGNGACDNQATVTINGNVYTITLH